VILLRDGRMVDQTLAPSAEALLQPTPSP